ncbi:MAG: DEAD/DEAH box helicase, partial [Nitrososphaerales archaeon]
MHRYRCPHCSSRLDLDRLYDGGYLARCRKCSLMHIARPEVESRDEAYLKVLEDYDVGKVRRRRASWVKILEEEGILRSRQAVKRIAERSGTQLKDLPRPVRYALLSKTDYPVLYRRILQEEPTLGESPKNLPIDKALSETLVENGVERLYRFQEESVNAILKGRDVVIVAPTGSGKTEAFAIPVIQLVSELGGRFGALRMRRGAVRALMIYPTKALARDQLPKLRMLAGSVGVRVAVFDGDTPRRERDRILEEPPDIIITNFDTLHHHFIHRTRFSRLLHAVKYVVVDEVHVYTGTFGSNIHFILKRLERLCGGFQAVAASATISNPKEFCEDLFGRIFTVVEGGEGKHGVIHFAMIFPTLRGHRALTLDLLKQLTDSGRKTIAFSSSHLAAELTAFYGRRTGVPVEVHRAGLLPSWRKSVEERFRSGDLKAISSTPTLELGIDIGTVDAVISDLVTWTRLIQRTGRAGRRGQESVVFLSLRADDPISQYYKNNPEDYFKDIEPGYIDPSNPVISRFQLLAASIDRPIKESE